MSEDTVTISRLEYLRLIADSLYAEIVGDIIESLPTGVDDLVGDDPRWQEYMDQMVAIDELREE